jgi:hypothetical protein
MSEGRTRLGAVGAVIAAVLVLLVALSPTLLFGEPISGFGLILMGASLIGVGLLVRWAVGARARTLGTMLVAIGAVILVVGLGLTAFVISSR